MHHERSMRRWRVRWPGVAGLAALSLFGVTAATSALSSPEERPAVQTAQDRGPELAEGLNLSTSEMAWLAQHPVVNIAFDPNWTPIEYFDAQGQPAGISAEYLQYLKRVLKVRFEPVRNLSWPQVLKGLKDGSIEMASAVQKTEQRKSFLVFTSPYMSLPVAIFTKEDVAYADMSTMKDKPIAVIRQFAVHDYLAIHQPQLSMVPVDSIKDGLTLVRQGKVFAFVEVFVIGSRGIRDNGFSDLHAAGMIDFRYEVSMGASAKHPELASILQKALTHMPETERAQYYQRWFAVPFVYRTDYSIVWWTAASAATLILLVLYWNRKLEQRVTQRTAELDDVNERLNVDLIARKQAEQQLLEVNELLERRVAERTADLEKASNVLKLRAKKFRALAAELAQTENREHHRIAQVLHDHPQQLLAAAKFNISSILSQVHDPEVKAPAEQVLDCLDQSIDALRSLTMELSPPILHDAGFVAGLHWLARWMSETHKLTVDVSATDLPSPLSEDLRILLFQAVRELLFNIVKHSGVKQACVALDSTNDGLRITVADEGRGFDATRTLTELPPTFGLLNIQERLALIDGRLDITSTLGHGTKAVLYVPVVNSAIPQAEVPQKPKDLGPEVASVAHPDRDCIRVLVADDHTVIRQGLIQLLRHETDLSIIGEAVDGQDAIEKARALRPDVILMDVSMPRVNGLDATQQIVSEMPEIRVIGLSLHEQDDMKARMYAAGAKRYLMKACPIEEIVTAIREVAHTSV